MEDSAFYIKIQTELTEPTTTRNGLKQGDGLAPLLFNIVLEYVSNQQIQHQYWWHIDI
jgi:hypothetical protein